MTAAQGGEGAWLEEAPSRLTPMVDLLCFAGAGAGASAFHVWRGRLPGFVALLACRLPGRESRIDEPPAASLAGAARTVAVAYAARRPTPRPVVLFGHSMGGVLAFETARYLVEMGRVPAGLLVCASEPPRGGTGVMGRKELEALLLAYDPANAAVVGNAELSAALLPVLQADIALLRSHRIAPDSAPLDVPAWLFSGRADRVVPRRSVARWAAHLAAGVRLEDLPGGHHFPFRESRDAVLARLAQVLCEAAGRAPG